MFLTKLSSTFPLKCSSAGRNLFFLPPRISKGTCRQKKTGNIKRLLHPWECSYGFGSGAVIMTAAERMIVLLIMPKIICLTLQPLYTSDCTFASAGLFLPGLGLESRIVKSCIWFTSVIFSQYLV